MKCKSCKSEALEPSDAPWAPPATVALGWVLVGLSAVGLLWAFLAGASFQREFQGPLEPVAETLVFLGAVGALAAIPFFLGRWLTATEPVWVCAECGERSPRAPARTA